MSSSIGDGGATHLHHSAREWGCSDAFAATISRGYIAGAVSVLHPGTLRFKPAQRSTSARAAGTPIRQCTTAHLRGLERIIEHPCDLPISRFVMMGSGIRIPL